MADQALSNLTAVSPQFPISTKREIISNEMWLVVKKITKVTNGATYNSSWVECKHFGRIVGTCLFDRSGVLTIDQSNDGFTADYQTTINTVLNVTDAFSIELVCPFVRLSWTEGGAGDTAVHKLYAYLKVV